MRVAVFGASGGIGRLVVQRLLADGNQVAALVRTPGRLGIDHPELTVRTGELCDAAAVRDLIAGSDAVISALGPSLKRGARGTPVSDGTRAIVTAMQEAGVRRFIGLATPSVPDPRDRPTYKAWLLPLMANVMFPNALVELRGMSAAITGSGLDWTVARISRPTDAPAKDTLRAGFLGRDQVGWAMTRADIAAFLVGQLGDTTFVRALPAISN
jgi:nucleoside-diphosphate-sugar epimerase